VINTVEQEYTTALSADSEQKYIDFTTGGYVVGRMPLPDDSSFHRYSASVTVKLMNKPDSVSSWKFWNLRRIFNALKYRTTGKLDVTTFDGMVPGVMYDMHVTYLDGKIQSQRATPINTNVNMSIIRYGA
jgi:hypothetical protein